MAKVSEKAKTKYNEKISEYKDIINIVLEEEKKISADFGKDKPEHNLDRLFLSNRNLGLVAYYSLLKGLNKLVLNEKKLNEDLENNWAVVGEAIQTILRREGIANPYELLKDLTRKDERINKTNLHEFIDDLDVSGDIKEELKKISPQNYTGLISF